MSTNEESLEKHEEVTDISVTQVPDALATLTTKQQRFIHLYLTGQYSLNQLAQLLEVHPNTLGNWLKNSSIQVVISDMQEINHSMVSQQLKAMTNKALIKLGDLISSPIDGVALQAVKDILDRAGHKARQEIKIDKTVTTVEQKMKELINATIIDVEVEESE